MPDAQPNATPPSTPPTIAGPVQTAGKDRDHMRLLAIFYFILGGLSLLGAVFMVFYLFMGILFIVGSDGMPANDPNGPPPEFIQMMGWFFIAFSAGTMLLSIAIGGLQIFTGVNLIKQRRHILCLVGAAVTCLGIPLGTVLGVFTLVVITRPSAKALFEANR